MIEAKTIEAITGARTFNKELKVKRIGKEVFEIIGFNYGEEESKMKGSAEEVAEYLSSYFGRGELIQ